MLIDAIYAFLIIDLIKKNQDKNFYDFLKHTVGKFFAKIFLILLMLRFMFMLTNISKGLEFFVVENFYTDKNNLQTHEISFYYIVKPDNFAKIPLHDYSTEEIDKGELKQHNFVWLDLDKLNEYDFQPLFIKEKIVNNNLNFEHIIVKE